MQCSMYERIVAYIRVDITMQVIIQEIEHLMILSLHGMCSWTVSLSISLPSLSMDRS